MSREQIGESVFQAQAGNWIDVSYLQHTYGYNGAGQLTTDTATDGVNTWVKTYTYTSGNLTGETAWVKQ